MGHETNQVLTEAIDKSESDIIIFFVVLAVIMVFFIIPLYGMILRDRKENRAAESKRLDSDISAAGIQQDKYMERERQIIAVVTANTEVMASLKATLELDGKSTNASLERIHIRIDKQEETLFAQKGVIIKLQTTLDELLRQQSVISEDIKRGFAAKSTQRNKKEDSQK